MLYYRNKRKMKADLIDQLIERKSEVWTSKIPVYSTALRPQGKYCPSSHNCGNEPVNLPVLNHRSDAMMATGLR